jgi:hypothetical protein
MVFFILHLTIHHLLEKMPVFSTINFCDGLISAIFYRIFTKQTKLKIEDGNKLSMSAMRGPVTIG